ncbi:DHS-like NAD/FAD-binding domain-containing protein [Hysterangium stoloniferum]|nr:DHS-like NAD/FAD-binding domain-containing protein [Hysterangium stoloniferum]
MLVTLDTNSSSTDISTPRALTSLSLTVSKSKRIVVVTGAGISCSCGIPDFRSSDGLYALVKAKYPDAVMKGRDLFDATLFRDPTSTALFYTFMAELKTSIDLATPSPTHYFIKTLATKGKPLRSYTQNIDGLEERTGLACSSSESVTNTGKAKVFNPFERATHRTVLNVKLAVSSHNLPSSSKIQATPAEERIARSARALKVGTLRPSIVLYCEPHRLVGTLGAVFFRPQSCGLITIKSSDPFDAPLIDPNEVALLVRGLKLLIKLANTEPMLSALKQDDNPLLDHNLGKLSDNELENEVRKCVETLYNPTSTCSMAPLEDNGVVDPSLKTAPSLAVGEKVSDLIKESLAAKAG